MKNLKKKVHILLIMAVMALAMLTPAQAAGAKLNKTKLTVEVGKKAKLKVKNTKKKVKWSSSKKKIASVNQKGVVTGKKAGKAIIMAKVGGKKLKCKVTVKKASATKPASDTTQASTPTPTTTAPTTTKPAPTTTTPTTTKPAPTTPAPTTTTPATTTTPDKTPATKPDTATTSEPVSQSPAKKNEWYMEGHPNNLLFWKEAVEVDQQFMIFVYGKPWYLTYDANGNLVAQIALKNQTMGTSYQLKNMYCGIRDPQGALLGEGTFTWSNCFISPSSYQIVTLTFNNGGTKKVVDLTEMEEIFYKITTN